MELRTNETSSVHDVLQVRTQHSNMLSGDHLEGMVLPLRLWTRPVGGGSLEATRTRKLDAGGRIRGFLWFDMILLFPFNPIPLRQLTGDFRAKVQSENCADKNPP